MYQHAYRLAVAAGATAIALAAPPALRDIALARADVLEYGLAGLAVWGLLQVITALLGMVERLSARSRRERGDWSMRPPAAVVCHFADAQQLTSADPQTRCGVPRSELGHAGKGYVSFAWLQVTCPDCLARRVQGEP